jgi:SpoIID/LytB domain protein
MEEPLIKVGICSAHTVSLTFVSEYFIKHAGINLFGNYKVKTDNSGIVLFDSGDNEVFRAEELEIVPTTDTADIFEIEDVTIGVDFHWERKEKQRFRGSISLIREEDKLTVINIIPLEQYLESVISSEMKADASIDFLKAHAVISRSWLLSRLKNKTPEEVQEGMVNDENKRIKWYGREEHKNFDVCADDHCQRYQGVTRACTDTVHNAVYATNGEVLKYGEEICDARFSKCCGGVSEDFENVWEDKDVPYLKMVVDKEEDFLAYDLTDEKDVKQWVKSSPKAFCNTTDKDLLFQVLNDYDLETKDFYRWEVEYTQEQLADIIKQRSGIDFGEIISLTPLSRGRSGRIIELEVKGTKKTMVVGKELEIRKILSESHLFSSAFIVEYSEYKNEIPQSFIITGAGWGHGVGLCQIGAAVMAGKGYSYEFILKHYFKGAELKKIY